jgi:transposase
MSTVEKLEAAGEVLSPVVRAVLEERDALAAQVMALQEQIRELQARLGRNSTNSSQPPSSDRPEVKRRKKKPSGRKRGGQPGHRGHHRRQVPAERVDEVVEHRPGECRHCRHSLEGAEEAKPARRHQVVELPAIRVKVTEHRMVCVRCPGCSKLTRAELPAAVRKKSFGPRLTGLAALLFGRFRCSRREVRELLGKLLDVEPPSLGSTQAMAREVAGALEPSYMEVREAVRKSESARADETSWKLSGKLHWLWVAESERGTLFHLGPSRGRRELGAMLGEDYGGIVTSDRWVSYTICKRRQLCWAHLQRNLEGLLLRGDKAAWFARRGLAICARLFEAMREVKEGSLPREALPTRMERCQARFGRLIRHGAGSEERKVAVFSAEMLKLEASLWTFLEHPIEPTNNAAERALRKAVLWRKGCFGSQSQDGLRFVERMLTLTETCRQLGRHPLDFLSDALTAARASAPSPKLLPVG